MVRTGPTELKRVSESNGAIPLSEQHVGRETTKIGKCNYRVVSKKAHTAKLLIRIIMIHRYN